MVKYYLSLLYFIFVMILPASAQYKIKPFEVPFVKDLQVYETNLRNNFIKIIRNESALPSPDSVDYTFIITIVTTIKDGDSFSYEDLISYNFLNKLKLAELQMSNENFFVDAFCITKSYDTVFLTYSYPSALLIGPKRISKHKQKAAFSLSKVNDWAARGNANHIQFLNFCKENKISVVISILPMLSRMYCISNDSIYTIDNMDIKSVRLIE